jgi:hypothetical protein
MIEHDSIARSFIVRLLFSPTPFPGYAVKLEWRREEYGGNWYFASSLGLKAGFVRRYSNISTKRPRNFMEKRSRKLNTVDSHRLLINL